MINYVVIMFLLVTLLLTATFPNDKPHVNEGEGAWFIITLPMQ